MNGCGHTQNYYNRTDMSFSILFPTNEFTAASKSPQQLQLLTLPASLSLPEILLHIATKGLPPQYPYLYKHLHQAHKNVLSFVCSKAPSQQSENQQLIAQAFRALLLEKNNQLTAVQRQLIFETCLECLNSLQFTANEQLVSIMEIILKTHIDKNKLIRRLENVALELGKAGQPSMSKITASRLVTILVGLNGCALKNQLFDVLKRVLADTEAQARKIGLSELFPKLLKNLDLQFIELHFQQRIYEAVWDQNEQIGVLALQVILRNASKFSVLQQSSRIVKLFIDSLTSKRERVAMMATALMGQTYQKLQNIILRSEAHCVRFWKSLVELSQSKNQKILNNMVYNLPGILILAAPYHRVDPLCDLFVELFYNPKVNKIVLAAYFHEMVRLFPSKWGELKDLVYWMMNQLLQQDGVSQQAVKITSKIMSKLSQIKDIFLFEVASAEGRMQKQQKYFQPNFCNFLVKYIDLLIRKKVSLLLTSFYSSLQKVAACFKTDFVEQILIPRLYSCLKLKVSGVQIIVEILLMLLSREGNPLLTNLYFSKASTQLMKSFRAHQRQLSLRFYYFCSFYFSIQTFNQFKLGEKYLSFNSDKNLKIKDFFIRNLPRISYFLMKQQKIQYSIIVNRLRKDNDPEIQLLISSIEFSDDQTLRQEINQKSKVLREAEREKLTSINLKKQQDTLSRKPAKQLRKDEVVRKRIESTKLKNKIQIKEAPKRRMTPIMTRATSITNVFRQP